MEGIDVYLTGKERELVIDALTNYIYSMSEGEETVELIESELSSGLGNAMYKLYKGLKGQQAYSIYTKGGRDERLHC